jgi:hypothetical protein
MADGTQDTVKLDVPVRQTGNREWNDPLDEGETLNTLVRPAVDRAEMEELEGRIEEPTEFNSGGSFQTRARGET